MLNTEVNPKHYTDLPVQPIVPIAGNDLDFLTGCAVKYLLRYKDTVSPISSLRKAAQYVEWLIERQEYIDMGIPYYGPSEIVDETAKSMLDAVTRFDDAVSPKNEPLSAEKIDLTIKRALASIALSPANKGLGAPLRPHFPQEDYD